MRRESPRRAGVIVVLSIATLLVAGCGATSAKPTGAAGPARVSAPDKAAASAQRAVAENRARLVTALRREWQRRGAAASVAAQRDGRRVSRSPQVVQVVDVSRDVCATGGPAATRAQRQARRVRALQRRRALYYLNLSCPAA